jgi:CRP-like cAMP-binding protein
MSEPAAAIPPQMIEKFNDPEWGAEQLQSIGIFKQFELSELSKIYQIGTVVPLKPNAHAVIEGESTRGLYIILHGNVSVYKNDTVTDSMHKIAFMSEGQAFGEMSLFDDAPRSATVAADTHCYLFHLDASVFDRFLAQEGFEFACRFYKKCAEDMAERFRAINSDYIISQQLLWKYALRRASGEETD